MPSESNLSRTENGLVPEGEGWFILNARESRWHESEAFGRYCIFEGDARFPELGINVSVLQPGQPGCMYHGEANQEDFLVLAGECLLLVEGEERPLRAWDFFHCPAWTEHVLVGAGSGPCLVLGVGARRAPDDVLYPVADVARKHDAGVTAETRLPAEAYARFPRPREIPYREGDLP